VRPYDDDNDDDNDDDDDCYYYTDIIIIRIAISSTSSATSQQKRSLSLSLSRYSSRATTTTSRGLSNLIFRCVVNPIHNSTGSQWNLDKKALSERAWNLRPLMMLQSTDRR
jgi:hypothetical protein